MSITIKANGKINLGLDVVRRLENGYHQVKMIMQAVELADFVTMDALPGRQIEITCENPKVPCDESNLAYKAATLMQQEYPQCGGIRIHIEKNIPIAAGMAGGSTDCAAVLQGMNQLYNLNLTLETLQKQGVKLGADVPYCLQGGTALSEGIGEVLTALKMPPQCFLVLAKPDIDVSTKYVYEHLKLDLVKHPDIDGMVVDIENGDLAGICAKIDNVLESVTGEQYPVVHQIEEVMLQQGALQSRMSGSGPTVFGIFEDEAAAKKAIACIQEQKLTNQVVLSRFA